MDRIITKMAPVTAPLFKRKRVAAYARVSSGKDAMLHSLSAQISYYSEYIQNNPGWEYVGVYADEALTGTKDNREEFQRLLGDCRAGLIDIVITKSISRFARNTVTMLETIRELKSLNIDVFFEKENVHTMSGDGELMLSILASFAQAESLSVSENCKWRFRKNFKEGIPSTNLILGYETINGTLEIVPEEAKLVKMIYTDFLNGMGRNAIIKKLNKNGFQTKLGCDWHVNTIRQILANEKYTGDMLLQKTFISNHIDKKKRINIGELPKYYVNNCHEPIIDRKIFERVQTELQKRATTYHKSKEAPKHFPFTSKIICEKCGKYYRRKINNAGSKYAKPVWICSTFNELGKTSCSSQQIPEDILLSLTAEVLSCSEFDETVFNKKLKELRVPGPNKLIYIFNNGDTFEKQWQHKSRSETWKEKLCVKQNQ